MNLNRSRVAAAGAISAALMVGMPVVTAASAGAVQNPAQIFDDPPPADEGTSPGAPEDSVLKFEVLDPPATQPTLPDALDPGAPPSKEDLEEPGLVIESTVNDVAEPVTGDQTQAIDLVRDDPSSDEQSGTDEPTADEPSSDEPSSDEPSSDDPTADGPAQGEAPAGEDANQGENANQGAPTGDLDNTQAGQNENAGDDSRVDAAAAPEATARTTSAASPVTGADAERSSAMALAGATIGGVLPDAPMPKTGAATVGLLQTGLALIGLGGLLVAGTGRHRRVSENRREQGLALTI